MSAVETTTLLAFDVGDKRIGVARATVPPRLAAPLMTILATDDMARTLTKLFTEQAPDALVIGRPRNQQGEPTEQTEKVEAWVKENLHGWNGPVYWQDESLTSVAAEEHLRNRGRHFTQTDIDAYAATIILTDFIESYQNDGKHDYKTIGRAQ